MKTLKRALLGLAIVAILGTTIGVPLRYHFVVFEGKTHIVQKHELGWDHTYIHLDREPLKRRLILQSPTLRAYFMKYYANVLLKWGKKESLSLMDRLRLKARKALDKAVQHGKKWVRREAPKQLRKLKQKAKEKLNAVKQTGKTFIQNQQK